MKVINEKFVEEKLNMYDYTVKAVRWIFAENSQLYAAIAKLMLDTGTDEFLMTLEDRELINNSYSIHFTKANDDAEDQTVKVEIIKHEYEPDEAEE